MKRLYFLLLCTSLVFAANAQRFEWTMGYTVADDFRTIVGGITDSLGNLYIAGSCDAVSKWEGEDMIPTLSKSTKSLNNNALIAKISPEGEMMWKKLILTGSTSAAHSPIGIKKLGDSVIACLLQFTIPSAVGYTYYLDTFVFPDHSNGSFPVAPTYPINNQNMLTGMMTLYLAFDFDGNVLEQHFLNITYTDADGNDIVKYSHGDVWYHSTWFQDASFDMDDDGNIYICRMAQDEYHDTTHTNHSVDDGTIRGLKFWVDMNPVGEYRIEGYPKYWYPQIVKFSPHFDTLLACKYVVQKDDGTSFYYNPTDVKLRVDQSGNVYYYTTLDYSSNNSNNTVYIDTLADISFTVPEHSRYTPFLAKYDSDLNAKWVIAFKDSATAYLPEGIGTKTYFMDIDFDEDSNLLFLFAETGRTSTTDTIHLYGILSYQGEQLNLKTNHFWCAFDNNNKNPTLHSYARCPEKGGGGLSVRGACKNNRVFMQNPYDGGIRLPSQTIDFHSFYKSGYALTVFDYSGRVIDGIDYGIMDPFSVTNTAGPIIIHDSVLYLCGLFKSDVTLGDFLVHNQDPINIIARYVDTAFMHTYVWSNQGITLAPALKPRVFPVPARDVLHFECPQGIATKVAATSVLGTRTDLPTKGNTADVSALAPGTYILEITTAKEHYYTKFVKQ